MGTMLELSGDHPQSLGTGRLQSGHKKGLSQGHTRSPVPSDEEVKWLRPLFLGSPKKTGQCKT